MPPFPSRIIYFLLQDSSIAGNEFESVNGWLFCLYAVAFWSATSVKRKSQMFGKLLLKRFCCNSSDGLVLKSCSSSPIICFKHKDLFCNWTSWTIRLFTDCAVRLQSPLDRDPSNLWRRRRWFSGSSPSQFWAVLIFNGYHKAPFPPFLNQKCLVV